MRQIVWFGGLLNATPTLFPHITETCPCNNAAISKSPKNDNFQMKNCDIFLIFAQNIDRRYTLEAVLTSNNNLCFGAKIIYAHPCKRLAALLYKRDVMGYTFHGHVCMMII